MHSCKTTLFYQSVVAIVSISLSTHTLLYSILQPAGTRNFTKSSPNIIVQNMQPQFIHDSTIDKIKQIDNQQPSIANSNSLQEKYMSLYYTNEDLVKVIYDLSMLKNINVILPQAPNNIKEKLTLHMKKTVTIEEAWQQLLTVLDIAGFSTIPKDDTLMIVRNTKNVSREPVPTYIGIDPAELPDSDQRIRYLYYLSNIKVSEEPNSELFTVLKNNLASDALIKFNTNTNAIILVEKARNIKAIMEIILELDQAGFHETMEFVPLEHAVAKDVAALFNEHILKTTNEINRYRLDTKKQSETPYFAKETKIVPAKRTNSLIIVGRAQAINRIKKFIDQHIDVKHESGKSILHIYKLQYLNAETFVPTLKKIVETSRISGTEQARAGKKKQVGTERFFDEVVIVTDTSATPEKEGYYGGNKIIIAARNEDWKQIKRLIEQLDTPQPQVLIETLVADLTLDDVRLLGALSRNPDKIPILNKMQFQSAQIPPGIIPDQVENPTTIAGDLLRKAFDSEGNLTDTDPTKSAASFARAGSTIIALNDNDGETWSILQLLDVFSYTKILSHPHVIATNNKKAVISIGEERYLDDEVSGSLGGTSVVQVKPFQALLKVEITPRISPDKTVNLQVLVTINEFIEGNAQRVRKVETNINMKDGSIYALGGLAQINISENTNAFPIIGQIPFFGWFTKRRQKQAIKNILTIFISPTIIEPRLRKGIGTYTRDYINISKDYVKETQLFGSLKDPITRWFFKTDLKTAETLDKFMQKSEVWYGDNHSEIPTTYAHDTSSTHNMYNTNNNEHVKHRRHRKKSLKKMLQKEQNPLTTQKIARNITHN